MNLYSWLTAPAELPSDQTPGSHDVHEKLRILVVGDSGTGKTCLIHRLTTGDVMSSVRWTVGCQISVMLHSLADERGDRPCVMEFWDVGGHRNYSDSRSVFYHKINGIIMVHDIANRKSFAHLRAWLDEVVREDVERKARGHVGVEETYFSKTQGAGRFSQAQRMHSEVAVASRSGPLDGLPILVVANKCDHGPPSASLPKMAWDKNDSVATSAVARTKDGRLPEQDKFLAFFDRVAQRRFASR
jgi:small GTP-binding protein